MLLDWLALQLEIHWMMQTLLIRMQIQPFYNYRQFKCTYQRLSTNLEHTDKKAKLILRLIISIIYLQIKCMK